MQKIDGYYCQTITESRVTEQNEIVVCGSIENQQGATFHSAKGKRDSVIPNGKGKGNSGTRIFIAKYDTMGNLIWKTTSSGSESTHIWAMNCDRDGNIVIGGNLVGLDTLWGTNGKFQRIKGNNFADYSTGGNAHNYFVAKFNSKGHILWSKVGLTNGNSYAKQIEFDARNNLYVLGYSTNNAISFDSYSLFAGPDAPRGYVYNFSLILIKYSPSGNEEWITYGGDTHVPFFQVNAAGEVKLFTRTASKTKIWNTDGYYYKLPDPIGLKMYDIFLDKNGHVKYATQAFSEITNAYIDKYVQDQAGNFYCLVYPNTLESTMGNYHPVIGNKKLETRKKDFYLVKCDADYHPVWTATVSGPYDDVPISIVLDKNENPVISGWYWWNVDIIGTSGNPVSYFSKIKEMFVASFTKKGEIDWVTTTGKLNVVKDYSIFCHMRFTKGNNLIVAATIGHPFDLDDLHIDISGPLEWAYLNKPVTNPDLVRYDFTDAYIAFRGDKIDPKKKIDTLPIQVHTNPLLVNKDSSFFTDTFRIAGIPVAFDSTVLYKSKQIPKGNLGNEPGINELPDGKINLQVFPNPVAQSQRILFIQIDVSKDCKMNLEIRDQNGKLHESFTENLPSGIFSKQINLQDYAPGLYYFNFVIDKEKIVKRIVVM